MYDELEHQNGVETKYVVTICKPVLQSCAVHTSVLLGGPHVL